ncbi:hypothetical protein MAR_032855 [Mya arenaria]|uniref:Uncharacterized protein n=1 Tax=Mya arenaria TaxID=6604 RepID=A0ABY7G7D2_MYAAR|nr:hypothetical protein MAR_032855 [Mya arenaria]
MYIACISPEMPLGAAMMPKRTTPTDNKSDKIFRDSIYKQLFKCQNELLKQILHQQKLTIDSPLLQLIS